MLIILSNLRSIKSKDNFDQNKYNMFFQKFETLIINDLSKNKLDYIVDILFSNKYLSMLFGEKDTKKIIFSLLQKIKEQRIDKETTLIKKLLDILTKENYNNINELLSDLENFTIIHSNSIKCIKGELLDILIRTMDIFDQEKKKDFEGLFSHFFKNIVFKNDNYNNGFFDILLGLFQYFVEKKMIVLYEMFIFKLFYSVIQSNKSSAKYDWLIKKTRYPDVILQALPDIFNEQLFRFYLSSLMAMSDVKNETDMYLPVIDLKIFFKFYNKYLNNPHYQKDSSYNRRL